MTPQNTSAVPLAVFAYNRPQHLRECLDALAACIGIGECRPQIYCDGPRGAGDAEAVAATRDVARRWAALHHATVIEPEQNLGLARSIIGATTSLCNAYGRVIAVEDDLVVAPPFVRYMLDGLAQFERHPEVYQIAGYMFGVRHPPQPASFFLPMVTTWGWATWQRAWAGVDWTAAGALERLQERRVRKAFDLDGSYPYTEALRARLAGQNQSWGILWWWHVFSRNGMALFPARTLVANRGFDGSGYHCPDRDWRGADHLESAGAPIAMPATVAADRGAFRRVTRFIQENNAPRRATWQDRLGAFMHGAIKRRMG
jgi:hypothetical protein